MLKTITLAAALAGLLLSSGAAADGTAIYEKHCLKCHGATGKGDGKAAAKLKPKPHDLSEAKWQAEWTDELILEVTKLGSKAPSVKKEISKKMPAYSKKLSDDEIKELLPVIRGFGKADKK